MNNEKRYCQCEGCGLDGMRMLCGEPATHTVRSIDFVPAHAVWEDLHDTRVMCASCAKQWQKRGASIKGARPPMIGDYVIAIYEVPGLRHLRNVEFTGTKPEAVKEAERLVRERWQATGVTYRVEEKSS